MARSRLLALPIELRLSIYRYHFRQLIYVLVHKLHVDSCQRIHGRKAMQVSDSCNLLFVSRTVYTEAKALLYEEATFGVYYCECMSMGQLMCRHWSQIRWLVVQHRSSQTFDSANMFFVKNFPPINKLKSLVLSDTTYYVGEHEGEPNVARLGTETDSSKLLYDCCS